MQRLLHIVNTLLAIVQILPLPIIEMKFVYILRDIRSACIKVHESFVIESYLGVRFLGVMLLVMKATSGKMRRGPSPANMKKPFLMRMGCVKEQIQVRLWW